MASLPTFTHLVLCHTTLELEMAYAAAQIAHLALVGTVALRVSG